MPGPQKAAALIKVAGASYHQLTIKASKVGDSVRLDPEPTNQFDPFAIRLINTRLEPDGWLGFIPKKYSGLLSQAMVKGHRFDAKIASLPTGWGPGGDRIVGATISLELVSLGVVSSVEAACRSQVIVSSADWIVVAGGSW